MNKKDNNNETGCNNKIFVKFKCICGTVMRTGEAKSISEIKSDTTEVFINTEVTPNQVEVKGKEFCDTRVCLDVKKAAYDLKEYFCGEREITEIRFIEIYKTIFSYMPKWRKMPESKEFLKVDKEHPVISAIKCAFWSNRLAHVDSFFNKEEFEAFYYLKNCLLKVIIKELIKLKKQGRDHGWGNNPFPSWGFQKDNKGKWTFIVDVPGYGQVAFHIEFDITEEILLAYPYKYGYAGKNSEFPDPRRPKCLHDALVVKKDWVPLHLRYYEPNFTYEGKGIRNFFILNLNLDHEHGIPIIRPLQDVEELRDNYLIAACTSRGKVYLFALSTKGCGHIDDVHLEINPFLVLPLSDVNPSQVIFSTSPEMIDEFSSGHAVGTAIYVVDAIELDLKEKIGFMDKNGVLIEIREEVHSNGFVTSRIIKEYLNSDAAWNHVTCLNSKAG